MMKTLSRNVLYYGSETPLPRRIPLRAGPLSMTYEGGDLRTLRLGEHEIVRRIYFAVRDRNWGTVAPCFIREDVQVSADSFLITCQVENRSGDIDFAWQGTLQGDSNGLITCSMEGTARTTFLKNRIGFCILVPAGCAGVECSIEHVGGMAEKAIFPSDICADQPVLPFNSLGGIAYPVGGGVWAELRFDGEIFEMEDQRLWTDASFKIYGTPLSLPYPVKIQAGTRVVQSVNIAVRSEHPVRQVTKPRARFVPEPVPVKLQCSAQQEWKTLPYIGLEMASHGNSLRQLEISRLKALHLHHLRVDLRLADPAYHSRLHQAVCEATVLGLELEVAVRVTAEEAQNELSGLRRRVDELQPPAGSWLVYPARELYQGGSPTETVLGCARQVLQSYDPEVPFAAGTYTDYIFLKRSPPPVEWMDQVCISMNPQVHAFDQLSLVETLEAQSVVIDSARRLAKELPVVVSPITLKPRYNPYATGSAPEMAPRLLPAEVDARQMSLFGAGWTLGSLRAMLAGGAASVTYYETTGWRGVMEEQNGSRLPQAFPSLPGGVFPLYHVLAQVGEFAGGQGAAVVCGDPLRISGLMLRKNERMRMLLANYTREKQQIILEGIQGSWVVRFLDETNAEEAMRAPETFGARHGEVISSTDAVIPIHLRPFGLAFLDPIG
jgi:hypothetical protein